MSRYRATEIQTVSLRKQILREILLLVKLKVVILWGSSRALKG
jgi:hypothetical protein